MFLFVSFSWIFVLNCSDPVVSVSYAPLCVCVCVITCVTIESKSQCHTSITSKYHQDGDCVFLVQIGAISSFRFCAEWNRNTGDSSPLRVVFVGLLFPAFIRHPVSAVTTTAPVRGFVSDRRSRQRVSACLVCIHCSAHCVYSRRVTVCTRSQ